MQDEMKYLAARTGRGLISRREFFGRTIALGGTAVMAETLLSSVVLAAGPKRGGTLTIGMGGGETTDSLDPALALSQVPYLYLSTMGNFLTTMSDENELLPSLAESWESSPDARVWTFRIRGGVEFHNGRTMTPQDVLLTLQRHRDEKSQSGAYGILTNIADLEVNGDNLVVTLVNADADFPYLLSDLHLVIQPGGGIDDPTSAVFTGAYRLKSFDPGVRIVMEKFGNHWDSTVGHFDEVVLLVINDSTARNSALQSGQVQMINKIGPLVASQMKQVPNVTVAPVAGRGMYVFSMFCDTVPFSDNDLRMALKLAIDREELLEKILAGYGEIGNDMPVNAAYPLFDSTIPQRQYDPEQAAHYYRKSGHSGEIILHTADGAFPGAINAAELFQNSARKAGITITVKREPDDGYWNDVWNKKPFCATYWSGRPLQSQVYANAYLSTSKWNDTRFKVPKFDAWLAEAQGELDQKKRREIYSEAGRYIRDNGGLINPLFNNFIDGYRNDQIAGWSGNPTHELMNDLAAVKCWQI